jgi:predicted O-linked N-acetylglucosamine transferase (SPINDLY family)/predicted SAM-dependent methyltransferase
MGLLNGIFRRKPEPAAPMPAAPEAMDDIPALVRTAYERYVAREREVTQRLLERVLELDAGHPDALHFLGAIAAEDKRELEAIDLFQRAVDARPEDAGFHFALASLLLACGRVNESIPHFATASRLQPHHVEAVGNLWGALLETGREEEVRIAVERARAEGDPSPYIHANLAHVYRIQGRIAESIAASRRVLEHVPDSADGYSDLLLTMNYSDAYTPEQLFAEHRAYAARFAKPYLTPTADRTWPRRLRIGYVSPDFRAHVVALFFEPILEHHDAARFEVFCYYCNRREDDFTARLRASAHHWRDCVDLSDAELAARIREDRIDILVDLAGHTGRNRLRVFAMKPAPVQVTYLGYPNTTGLAAIDYRISDPRVDPPGNADQFSAERLLRLPSGFHCYRPRADSPEVGPLPAAGNGFVTFGCLNNFAKLSDSFFDAVARVLAAVPDSRLILKGKGLDAAYVVDGVRERFRRAGIDVSRLELLGWKPTFGSHLSVYGQVDIALDSFPYNGTTTTCEALWMGVPVISMEGDRHAARVGMSLLHAVGLNDLVARDVQDYVAICATLAADRGRLAELRRTLRERVARSPLLDEARITQELESALVRAWQEHVSDAHIDDLGDRAIEQLLHEAAQYKTAGERPRAIEVYERVLQSRPAHAQALNEVWNAALDGGNPGGAIHWLNKAIAREETPLLLYMRGCCFQAQGNARDSIASFKRALELDPGMAKACNNLGHSLELVGNLAEALECYTRASELDPALAVARYNEGNLRRQLGDLAGAVDCIRRAIALAPGHADWHCNLADLLHQQLQLDDAVESYRCALELDPRLARAWSGLGLTLHALGRAEDAEQHLRRAVELEPKVAHTHSNLLFVLHSHRGADGGRLLEEHQAWARRHGTLPWQSARSGAERRRADRLRIGYVSPDFCRHPVAGFIEPVLAAHDREGFEIFAYSNAARPDEVTARLKGMCDHWRDIAGVRDEEVAERIRFDGIDILVDLAGHTGHGRMRLFARKPAPVQVTWLGYPGTTGLSAIDYRITDETADPAGMTEDIHTERLVRLRGGFLCWTPPPEAPEVAEPPSERNGHVTFASFSNLSKVTPGTVELWARLLQRVPGSRLVLKSFGLSSATARGTLAAQFGAHGIEAARLELLGPEASYAAHLARYGDADIALDTFPYNGTTTTCEALWMGVPVVSLCGATHLSRVGRSLLERVDLTALAVEAPDQYVEAAAALAEDLPHRRRLRATLRERMRVSLLDGAGFTRELEAAYQGMWAHYASAEREPMRLHIGGTERKAGWKVLNIQPGPHVDFVGDCSDLSRFADESVDEIYASHVVEHVGYLEPMKRMLGEFHRVLRKGGSLKASVPDFEVLCRLFIDPRHSSEERFHIMRMAFGGQTNPHDFHYVGWTFEFLTDYLQAAGFSRVERVGDFHLFDDTSSQRFSGVPISLNVVAYK